MHVSPSLYLRVKPFHKIHVSPSPARAYSFPPSTPLRPNDASVYQINSSLISPISFLSPYLIILFLSLQACSRPLSCPVISPLLSYLACQGTVLRNRYGLPVIVLAE